MKLRKIEILGFKSFRAKTGIEIGDGITGVIGPNGCGKSNIVDAIRWAMGSQSPRDLRGRAMEDVIFNGSENHKPMGFAEVSITFENDPTTSLLPLEWRDQSAIKVTRRLFRSGDSDYEINGSRARLRDVHDVFAGTGVSSRDAYSIIEQGRIGFVVAARPEERRVIIEEAAGITRYKNQRKLAAKRLEKTNDNLLRVGDVVREVARQVASLERQAEKAAKARQLSVALRRGEMIVLARTIQDDERAYHDALRDFAAVEERSKSGQIELASAEARLVAARTVLATCEAAANQAAEHAYQQRARVELLRANLEHRERERATNERQKIEALTRKDQDALALVALEREADEARALEAAHQENSDGLIEALEAAEDAARAARDEALVAHTALEHARASLAECERTLARSGTRAEALRDELRTLSTRRQDVEVSLEELQERVDHAKNLVRNAEQESADGREALDEAKEQVEDRRQAQRAAETRLEATHADLRQAAAARRSAEAALESVKNLLSTGVGIADGARAVLATAKAQGLAGVHGPVAARLRVKDGHHGRLSAALAEFADAVVVDRGETAMTLLELARNAGKSLTVLSLEDAVEGDLCDWVEALAPVPRAFARRLTAVSAPDVLTTWERPSVDERRLWTDGEGQFAIRGGAMAAEQLLKAQQERDVLEEQVVEAFDREDAVQRRLTVDEQSLAQTREAREIAEERARILEDAQRRARLHLEELRGSSQQLERTLARTKQEMVSAQERYAALEADFVRVRDEAQRASEARDALSDDADRARTAVRRLDERREACEERLTSLRVQYARHEGDERALAERRARIDREREATRIRLTQWEETLATADHTDRLLAEAMADEREALQASQEAARAADIAAEEAKQAFDAQSVGVRELELVVSDARRFSQAVDKDREGAMVAVERLRHRLDVARASASERFQMSSDALIASVGDDVVDDALRATMDLQRRELERLGPVNPAAEDEYIAAQERHHFLSEQKLDLESAVQDLSAAIEKMDRTCRELFETTFDQVNEGFQRLFPRLFRGGKARLELTDPNDLLTSGVDIIAQPPGKRLQNMTLLSGGEKALTAAALIFSIFELRPSPICILDEVDAPLDEANVGRFAEMVREISDRSQFLIITHNTRTMEVADTLYGVTMQEPGVSKLVGVQLRDAEVTVV